MTSRDLVLPAFFGDALALGAHWIYDAEDIDAHFPDGVTNYADPQSAYHPGKKAGDFTHYGDQTLVLLESLVRHGGFDHAGWRSDWLAYWQGQPSSYLDGATRHTLENLSAGLDRPSDSHDLGGASRVAALFALHPGSDTELVEAARDQTALTHGDPRVIGAAGFIALATRRILAGDGFRQAFEKAAAIASHSPDLDEAASAAEGSVDSLAEIGLSCDVAVAFPLTLALALKFEQAPVAGLRENAGLGGDSAARGLPLGLWLGARHGLAAFPAVWSESLSGGPRIDAALQALDRPTA